VQSAQLSFVLAEEFFLDENENLMPVSVEGVTLRQLHYALEK